MPHRGPLLFFTWLCNSLQLSEDSSGYYFKILGSENINKGFLSHITINKTLSTRNEHDNNDSGFQQQNITHLIFPVFGIIV